MANHRTLITRFSTLRSLGVSKISLSCRQVRCKTCQSHLQDYWPCTHNVTDKMYIIPLLNSSRSENSDNKSLSIDFLSLLYKHGKQSNSNMQLEWSLKHERSSLLRRIRRCTVRYITVDSQKNYQKTIECC